MEWTPYDTYGPQHKILTKVRNFLTDERFEAHVTDSFRQTFTGVSETPEIKNST